MAESFMPSGEPKKLNDGKVSEGTGEQLGALVGALPGKDHSRDKTTVLPGDPMKNSNT